MVDMIEGDDRHYFNIYNDNRVSPSGLSPTVLRQKRNTAPCSYYGYSSNDKKSSPLEKYSLANKPFKNISNFVFPNMGERLASSKMSLTRSMTLVAKASQLFLSPDNSTGKKLGKVYKETEEDDTDVDIEQVDEVDANVGKDNCIMGSPIQGRNKIIRRIHSMYLTTKEKESFSMEDNSYLHKSGIKSFKVPADLIPRIDVQEMIKILLGKADGIFDEYIIIDCRFSYEFEGGHISGAINISTKEELVERFLTTPYSPNQKKQLLIFHCEFSSCRGPSLASHLRRSDRMLNSDNYPKLTYPDIVILDGGYRQFFDSNKEHCFPRGYVEMKDVNYQDACEQEMGRVRQANKLTRAKSYNHFSSERPASLLHSRSHSLSFSKGIPDNVKVAKKSSTKGRSATISSISKLESRLVKAAGCSQDLIFNSPSSNSIIDDDFQPPSALFRSTHRRNVMSNSHQNSSSFSINSSTSSFTDPGFSSTDSLTESHSSPSFEFNDFFDTKPNNLTSLLKTHSGTKSSLLNPLTRKPSLPVPPLPKGSAIQNGMDAGNSFKFPNSCSTLKTKASRQGLRINTPSRSGFSALLITSPTSPITDSHDSIMGTTSSIADPIDDVPIDFSDSMRNQRYSHRRRRSGSLLSSGGASVFNLTSEDIIESNEEQDDYTRLF